MHTNIHIHKYYTVNTWVPIKDPSMKIHVQLFPFSVANTSTGVCRSLLWFFFTFCFRFAFFINMYTYFFFSYFLPYLVVAFNSFVHIPFARIVFVECGWWNVFESTCLLWIKLKMKTKQWMEREWTSSSNWMHKKKRYVRVKEWEKMHQKYHRIRNSVRIWMQAMMKDEEKWKEKQCSCDPKTHYSILLRNKTPLTESALQINET